MLPNTERRAALAKNSKAKGWWITILILLILFAVSTAYQLATVRGQISQLSTNSANVNIPSETLNVVSNVATATIAMTFLLTLVLIFGVVRLADWTKWLFWVAVALSLLFFNLLGLVVMLLCAFTYRYLMKLLFGKASVEQRSDLPPS